jgi:putative ABC transport system permease protein
VESAAVAARLPITYTPELSAINITGRAQSDHSSGLENLAECKELLQKAGLPCHGAVGTNQVTAGYFHTLGVRLLRGRLFDERDQADAPLTTVLSETAARKYWPNEDPVGKRFTMNFSNWLPQYEIIGVVADIKTDGLNSPFTPEIYQSMSQTPSDDSELIIRTKGAPETFSTLVREEMKRFDRDIPLRNVRTMDDVIAGALWQSRLAAWLLGLFAALAALLAAAGLYGVMRYSISQRTNEIGIRMALGAQAADVLRMILREGAILLTVGMATGLVAAVALRRFLASYLFDVTATDPLTYIGVAALLAPAALLACYLPARRATKVDPLIALRRQ